MCGVFQKYIFALAFVALTLPQAARAEDLKTLVVFGDSLVAGYGLKREESLPEQLQARLTKEGLPVKVYNSGVSGDTTTSALNRLDYALRTNPDYFIIVLGGNDMLRGIDPVITRENLRRMMEKIKERDIPVMLGGMRAPGAGSKQIDMAYMSMYQTLAKQYGAVLYPFILEGVAMNPDLNQKDGVHPTAAGVAVIVDKILPSVAELLVKKGNGADEEEVPSKKE